MKFNYSYEKGKFEAEWARLRDEYRAAGMDEAAIEAMREFDWGVFKSERTYRRHNQELPCQCFEDDGDEAGEDRQALLSRFYDAFAVSASDVDPSRRDGWIDEIDSESLNKAVSALDDDERELLTRWVFEEQTLEEIAAVFSVSQSTISYRISCIRKKLKIFF